MASGCELLAVLARRMRARRKYTKIAGAGALAL